MPTHDANDVTTPPAPSRALTTAIQLTLALVQSLREAPASEWASQLREYAGQLRACGVRNRPVLASLLWIVSNEMQRLGDTGLAPSADTQDSVTAMIDSLEQDARRLSAATGSSGGRSARVHRVAALIEQRFGETLTLQQLAASVGYHRVSLATEFRQETGITVHAYLVRVRIRRAAELLRRGEKIEPVILLVGYRSKKNFYRHFKTQMGMTPGEYKECQRLGVGDSARPYTLALHPYNAQPPRPDEH